MKKDINLDPEAINSNAINYKEECERLERINKELEGRNKYLSEELSKASTKAERYKKLLINSVEAL
jgi:hypothetical protein